MAYATKQDMIDRFGLTELIQISNRDETWDEINEAALAKAQVDADSEIDAYLQGRYTLPLTHVPAALCRIACDLTRYYLYSPRTTEEVEKRYDSAVKFLRAVSKGEVNLGIAANDSQPATTTDPVRISTRARIFGDDVLKDY